MPRNIFDFTADIKKNTNGHKGVVTANDGVTFIVDVTDNGRPMDLSGVTQVILANSRPHMTTILREGTVTGESQVTFELGTSEIESSGEVTAVIQIFGADGRVSSTEFTYKVKRDPTDDETAYSETEQSLIESVLFEGPEIIEEARQVAAGNKTTFLPAVSTVAERDSNYPNPSIGDTVRVTGEAKVYRFVEGGNWIVSDQYNPTAIDELTVKLAETTEQVGSLSYGQPFNSIWKEFESRGVNVDWFGAVGDGETDDSQAIQSAFDNAQGRVVMFSTGKKYLINSPVAVDLTKCNGIFGNQAHVFTEQDIIIFNVTGNLGSDAGAPGPNNFLIVENEMMPIIQGLKIYSTKPETWEQRETSPSVATAINLEKTHSVTVKDCFFYQLHTGISFTVKNRNPIITNNHFYDMYSYGLHFKTGHNIHQSIISSNYFQSFYKALFDEGNEFGDMVFQGNLLESTNSARGTSHFIHITSGMYNTFLNIIGNRFQDKELTQNAIIELDFKQGAYAREILIADNEINSDSVNALGCYPILMKNPRNFIVKGNNIRNFHTEAVKVTGDYRGVTGALISSNSIRSTVGMVSIDTPNMTLDNININNNISTDSFFESSFTDFVPNIYLNGAAMTQININNNQVFYYATAERPNLSTGGAYHIVASGFVRALVIHSNSLYSRMLIGTHAIALDDRGDGWTQSMIVKDNMLRNFSSGLKLPTTSAIKIVSDNANG